VTDERLTTSVGTSNLVDKRLIGRHGVDASSIVRSFPTKPPSDARRRIQTKLAGKDRVTDATVGGFSPRTRPNAFTSCPSPPSVTPPNLTDDAQTFMVGEILFTVNGVNSMSVVDGWPVHAGRGLAG
jgi:hypothetical protein